MSYFGNLYGEELKTDGTAEDKVPMPLIPHGTRCLASIDEVKWKEDGQNKGTWNVNVRWAIMSPEQYKNRKVYQNLKVESPNVDVAKKSIRMLAAIDANCGGKILAMDRKASNEEFMMNWTNRPMMIELKVFSPKDGDPMNLVDKVAPRTGAPVQQQQSNDNFDDIPF